VIKLDIIEFGMTLLERVWPGKKVSVEEIVEKRVSLTFLLDPYMIYGKTL
jgi:uncharacterized protein YfeS